MKSGTTPRKHDQEEDMQNPLAFLETAQLTHGGVPITKDNFVDYTCFFTAYMRALETGRDEPIIKDPFAQELAGEVGSKMALLSGPKWTSRLDKSTNMMAIRTKYLDEALDHRDPSIQQVVILAAGLDARAYRLESLKNAHVFELDRCKGLKAYKEEVLHIKLHAQPKAKQVTFVETDLAQDAWDKLLVDHGFDPSKRTFWVLEGLLYYLKEDVIAKLLKCMNQLSAPKSEFWADMCGKQVLEDVSWSFTSLILYGEDDVEHGVLSLLQWDLSRQANLSSESTHFGRKWTPVTVKCPHEQVKPLPWVFVTGKKPTKEKELVQP